MQKEKNRPMAERNPGNKKEGKGKNQVEVHYNGVKKRWSGGPVKGICWQGEKGGGKNESPGKLKAKFAKDAKMLKQKEGFHEVGKTKLLEPRGGEKKKKKAEPGMWDTMAGKKSGGGGPSHNVGGMVAAGQGGELDCCLAFWGGRGPGL